MKCFECDKTVQIKKYRAYMYSRIGLSNICLMNQKVEVCSFCGTETPVLRNVRKLHQAIAIAIALQPGSLSSADLRYLRRSAGFRTSEMANRLSVADETYSKWENGKRPISPNADKLARLSFLALLERENSEEYRRHSEKVLETEISESQRSLVVAIDVDDFDRPARYLPDTHELFDEKVEASILTGVFLTFEHSSLEAIMGVAYSCAAPVTKPEIKDVCYQFAPTA